MNENVVYHNLYTNTKEHIVVFSKEQINNKNDFVLNTNVFAKPTSVSSFKTSFSDTFPCPTSGTQFNIFIKSFH